MKMYRVVPQTKRVSYLHTNTWTSMCVCFYQLFLLFLIVKLTVQWCLYQVFDNVFNDSKLKLKG